MLGEHFGGIHKLTWGILLKENLVLFGHDADLDKEFQYIPAV